MWVSGGRSSKLQRSALLPLLINREIELGSGATGAPCRPYDEHGGKISTVYYISQESAKDWQPPAQRCLCYRAVRSVGFWSAATEEHYSLHFRFVFISLRLG